MPLPLFYTPPKKQKLRSFEYITGKLRVPIYPPVPQDWLPGWKLNDSGSNIMIDEVPTLISH